METTGVIRHIAQFAAGWLVARGKLDPALTETLVGVVIGAFTLGWYWYEKKKA